MELHPYLKKKAALIDAALDQALPTIATPPHRLHQAMRHSVMGGGKRLRPILCLAATEALGGDPSAAMTPACAIEILHTYTLIHDDLPAMDDDHLRRGRPTCHIAFDEATAILAGDALLTLCFRLLCDAAPRPPFSAIDLVRELSDASGSTGVIGGQMADIEGENQTLSIDQLVYIHTHKTGDLIRAAIRMGAMIAGSSPEHLQALSVYADKIGLAFQIADDVLNATGTAAELGKSVGTDTSSGKMTYVAAYGIEGAQQRAADLIKEAKQSLHLLPGPTAPLSALADYMIDRRT